MRTGTLPPPVLPATPQLRPVHQVPGDNQCLRCCIATIFRLPLEQVPFFGGALAFDPEEREMGGFGALQERELRDWLRGRGLEAIQLYRFLGDQERQPLLNPWGLCVANGPTVRGTYHSVVWDAGFWDYPWPADVPRGQPYYGRMVYDPHPSGAGLTRVESWTCFALMDPLKTDRAPVPASTWLVPKLRGWANQMSERFGARNLQAGPHGWPRHAESRQAQTRQDPRSAQRHQGRHTAPEDAQLLLTDLDTQGGAA